MNRNEIKSAKTAELLAFYNSHQPADKQIIKFTNRETAEKRLAALFDKLALSSTAHNAQNLAVNALQAAAAAKIEADKVADKVDAVVVPSKAAESKEKRNAAAPARKPTDGSAPIAKPAPAQAEAPKPIVRKVLSAAARKSNAAGIAASWNDSEVREARLLRQGVVVTWNGKSAEYRSTHAAFDALGLPTTKVIRFRMKLKEAGKLAFTHEGVEYFFTIL